MRDLHTYFLNLTYLREDLARETGWSAPALPRVSAA